MYNFLMKFILASASPRRKEILLKAGYDFEIVPSCYDENISGLTYSNELVKNCAYQKALDVKKRINADLPIISADTVVVLDNLILGKPKNCFEAFNMLKQLSNRTHFIATSICLISKDKIIKDIEITYVTFRNLSEFEIINYIKTQSPFDKAGSYGIQDKNFDFVLKTDGNIDNVVGFPLRKFNCLVEKLRQCKW